MFVRKKIKIGNIFKFNTVLEKVNNTSLEFLQLHKALFDV